MTLMVLFVLTFDKQSTEIMYFCLSKCMFKVLCSLNNCTFEYLELFTYFAWWVIRLNRFIFSLALLGNKSTRISESDKLCNFLEFGKELFMTPNKYKNSVYNQSYRFFHSIICVKFIGCFVITFSSLSILTKSCNY